MWGSVTRFDEINGLTLAFFVYFRSFQKQFYRKFVGFSWIWTQIVGVEGEHTDHLTTTTALHWQKILATGLISIVLNGQRLKSNPYRYLVTLNRFVVQHFVKGLKVFLSTLFKSCKFKFLISCPLHQKSVIILVPILWRRRGVFRQFGELLLILFFRRRQQEGHAEVDGSIWLKRVLMQSKTGGTW